MTKTLVVLDLATNANFMVKGKDKVMIHHLTTRKEEEKGIQVKVEEREEDNLALEGEARALCPLLLLSCLPLPSPQG